MENKQNINIKTVSILIPMYNSESVITRCLDSIISQTFSDYEVILVNDGSTDRTLSLAKEYENNDTRFHVFSMENKGVAAARNECLRHAKGSYVQFVDSDDWIDPDMLGKMVEAMREDIDIVFCHNDRASKYEDTTVKKRGRIEYLDHDTQIREFLKHKIITGMLWNKLIRRDLLRGVVFDEKIGYGEDAQGLWQVLQKSRKMVIIPEVLYHHTDNPTSISDLKYSHTKFMANVMWAELASDVKKKYPQYEDLVRERQLATATYSRYEMIRDGYKNKSEKIFIRRIVRNNFDVINHSSFSKKMKLFALLTYLGI